MVSASKNMTILGASCGDLIHMRSATGARTCVHGTQTMRCLLSNSPYEHGVAQVSMCCIAVHAYYVLHSSSMTLR
jgi:hypothetical protein